MGQTTLHKNFSGVKKIRMTTASGSCKIQKSKGSEVEVDLQHTFDQSRYEPRIEQEGDRLMIKEIFHGNTNNGNSTWTLSIPEGMSVAFTTGSGNLDVSGLTIELDATTGSGDLTFTDLKGDVEGTTGSGDVELINFNGEINANTGSGNMRVEKSTGDISLNCGSGNLKLNDNKAAFAANTGSGNITARNLTLQGSSRFNTGSGDAEVILASSPTFDLSVNSGSGDAELNFNGNEIKGEIVMKASKKHGNIIAPFDFDKTEEIDNYGDNTTVVKTAVKGNGTNRISVGTGSGSAIIKK